MNRITLEELIKSDSDSSTESEHESSLYNSTETSDSSIENVLLRKRRKLYRTLDFIEKTLPNYDEEEFRGHFRLKRTTCYYLRLFVNRDYVFNRRYLIDMKGKMIYLVSKSTEHPHFPKYPEKYRIEDYWSCMVIKPYTEINKPGIEFSLSYFDNPGVNIPSSVTTWVAMRAMPDFLERLRGATKKYREFCKNEGVSVACKIINEEERVKEELLQKGKLEYCTFKPNENVKLKVTRPMSDAVDKMAKSSNKYESNLGNVNRTVDNNSSDTNAMPPSAVVQAENSNLWKYLHPLYYFH